MKPIKHIIKARWVICADSEQTVLENHALIIHQGVIKDILPIDKLGEHEPTTQCIDYPHHVIMPGFINAHTHLGMNFFRGLGSDHALMDWLQKFMWPAEKQWLNHEFVCDATLFAMGEMIRSGTTCFNDMYFYPKAIAEACDISGMRGSIGMHIHEFENNWANTIDDCFLKGLEFYEEYKHHPLITPTWAPHSPYAISDQTFIRTQEMAEQLDLKINLHLHETEDEINHSLQNYKKRPIKRLHDLGFLSSRVIAIHSTCLNEEDLNIYAATQPSIVHCPSANLKLASGICPVKKLQTLGLTIALGTDSVCSNNDLNMINEMRSANFLSKISTMNPLSLNAMDTIAMATMNGAKTLGNATQTGSLKIGKAADFIAMDLDEIETLPIFNIPAQVVYASSRQQVTDVWVAGQQLMKDRVLLTLDETDLKSKAHFWGDKITKGLSL